MTDLIEGGREAGFATVKAILYDENGKIIASAHGTETRANFPQGHVEKAETASIGRALAMAGFGTQFTDDLDEGERYVDSPQMPRGGYGANQGSRTVIAELWEGPGQCPSCHCPAGARHGTNCQSRAG